MAKERGLKRPHTEIAAAAAVAAAGAVGATVAHTKRVTRGKQEERAFSLRSAEPLPDGLRRVARGQLDDARDELRGASGRKVGSAVHEARKSLKRLRAVARLSRDAIGDDAYRQENAAFRDAGRRLSGARDAKVLIDTLDAVQETAAKELHSDQSADLRARLESEHDAEVESLRERGAAEAVLGDLESARARVATWSFESDGFEALEPGVRRIYRRGRKAMKAAAAEPTTESLHEWRKRVKDLWHVAQVLRPASPKRMKKLAASLHDLSNLLGDDHDLAVLRGYVERHPDCVADPASRAALVAVIERRRSKLQGDALARGRKLYSDSPADFTRELTRGWRKHARAVA